MITRINADLLSLLALGATTVSAWTSSEAGVQNGCYWDVPGVGSFNTHFNGDWNLHPYEAIEEIISSTYTVAAGNSPLARRFDMVNIGLEVDPVTGGAITLTVPGGQTGGGPVSSAQLITSYNDILYGSVRTVAMVSDVSGTTHGFSMYSNDNQEIDFAFLTRDSSVVHLTNEQVATDSPASSFAFPAPADATSAWHEYRVDWMADHTAFYIDGVLITNITDNVPTQPGHWIWNNWSNGNSWTHGPPAKDAVLKIRSIDAYYNRVAVAAVAGVNPDFCGAAIENSPTTTAAPSSTTTPTTIPTSSAESTTTPLPVTFVTSVRTSQGSAAATATAAPMATNPFTPFVPVTPPSSGFYLQAKSSGSSNGNYAAVSAGAGGEVSFVTSMTAASRFTIDASGNLIEHSPSQGYAANLNFDINVQKVDFGPLGQSNNFGYLSCQKQNGVLSCGVNGVSYSAATCGGDGSLYFAETVPDSCTAVTLSAVSN